MSTNLAGFQSFFRFFATFCIGQISYQQHKGYDRQFDLLAHLFTDIVSCYTDQVENGVHIPGVINRILLCQDSNLQHLKHSEDSISNKIQDMVI